MAKQFSVEELRLIAVLINHARVPTGLVMKTSVLRSKVDHMIGDNFHFLYNNRGEMSIPCDLFAKWYSAGVTTNPDKVTCVACNAWLNAPKRVHFREGGSGEWRAKKAHGAKRTRRHHKKGRR